MHGCSASGDCKTDSPVSARAGIWECEERCTCLSLVLESDLVFSNTQDYKWQVPGAMQLVWSLVFDVLLEIKCA